MFASRSCFAIALVLLSSLPASTRADCPPPPPGPPAPPGGGSGGVTSGGGSSTGGFAGGNASGGRESGPSGPSTPSTPSAGRGGASTPSPSGGGAATPTRNGTKVSTPTFQPRGAAAQRLVKMIWDHPVYRAPGEGARTEDTHAVAARAALPYSEAIRYIAGDDPRPLLVLRECKHCNQTDRALLTTGVDNEKTILFSRWFHCVRLSYQAWEEDSAFHNLFDSQHPEHLFVCNVDGSNKIALESTTSRPELWTAMTRTLAGAYTKDPMASYKDLARLLDRLDDLDRRTTELALKRAKLVETEGGSLAGLEKVEAEIAVLKQDHVRALNEVERVSKLELRAHKSVGAANAAR